MNSNALPDARRTVPPALPSSNSLTHVELIWIEKQIERWIRFGRDVEEKILDRRRRVLQAIDAVEGLGINPADADPNHWRHVYNRLTAGEEPRRYTRTRHDAWLLRRKIGE